ncbi:unnamed protein product [Amoebophrya sp. A25]|nr:unnamed protein product [Amoebophrya sp. A25]|eukprot:GSA25T00004899001.1
MPQSCNDASGATENNVRRLDDAYDKARREDDVSRLRAERTKNDGSASLVSKLPVLLEHELNEAYIRSHFRVSLLTASRCKDVPLSKAAFESERLQPVLSRTLERVLSKTLDKDKIPEYSHSPADLQDDGVHAIISQLTHLEMEHHGFESRLSQDHLPHCGYDSGTPLINLMATELDICRRVRHVIRDVGRLSRVVEREHEASPESIDLFFQKGERESKSFFQMDMREIVYPKAQKKSRLVIISPRKEHERGAGAAAGENQNGGPSTICHGQNHVHDLPRFWSKDGKTLDLRLLGVGGGHPGFSGTRKMTFSTSSSMLGAFLAFLECSSSASDCTTADSATADTTRGATWVPDEEEEENTYENLLQDQKLWFPNVETDTAEKLRKELRLLSNANDDNNGGKSINASPENEMVVKNLICLPIICYATACLVRRRTQTKTQEARFQAELALLREQGPCVPLLRSMARALRYLPSGTAGIRSWSKVFENANFLRPVLSSSLVLRELKTVLEEEQNVGRNARAVVEDENVVDNAQSALEDVLGTKMSETRDKNQGSLSRLADIVEQQLKYCEDTFPETTPAPRAVVHHSSSIEEHGSEPIAEIHSLALTEEDLRKHDSIYSRGRRLSGPVVVPVVQGAIVSASSPDEDSFFENPDHQQHEQSLRKEEPEDVALLRGVHFHYTERTRICIVHDMLELSLLSGIHGKDKVEMVTKVGAVTSK